MIIIFIEIFDIGCNWICWLIDLMMFKISVLKENYLNVVKENDVIKEFKFILK